MSIEIDILRTVKVNGAISFSNATEQVFPDGANQYAVTVLPSTTNQQASLAWTLSRLKALVVQSGQPVTLGVNAVNAAQTLTVTGSPTGGTFTISGTFPSAWTTAAIAYNATAAQVAAAAQAAIVALGTTGAGAVVAGTGGPLPATAVLLALSGTVGAQPVSTMTVAGSFTGGSSPAGSFASTTTGVVAAQTVVVGANVPLVWTAQAGYGSCPITASSVSTVCLTNAATVATSVLFVVGQNAS